MNSKGTSYLLWLAVFLGFGGLHRFYNGKMASGVIWLLTGGLFGIGQFIDLFLIPDMVEEHNMKRLGGSLYLPIQPTVTQPIADKLTDKQLKHKLIQSAQARGGRLSVTQAVVDTGADFPEVEAALMGMAKKGQVDIQNDPRSGAVVYVFHEL